MPSRSLGSSKRQSATRHQLRRKRSCWHLGWPNSSLRILPLFLSIQPPHFVRRSTNWRSETRNTASEASPIARWHFPAQCDESTTFNFLRTISHLYSTVAPTQHLRDNKASIARILTSPTGGQRRTEVVHQCYVCVRLRLVFTQSEHETSQPNGDVELVSSLHTPHWPSAGDAENQALRPCCPYSVFPSTNRKIRKNKPVN